jgi:hypothetical protein
LIDEAEVVRVELDSATGLPRSTGASEFNSVVLAPNLPTIREWSDDDLCDGNGFADMLHTRTVKLDDPTGVCESLTAIRHLSREYFSVGPVGVLTDAIHARHCPIVSMAVRSNETDRRKRGIGARVSIGPNEGGFRTCEQATHDHEVADRVPERAPTFNVDEALAWRVCSGDDVGTLDTVGAHLSARECD